MFPDFRHLAIGRRSEAPQRAAIWKFPLGDNLTRRCGGRRFPHLDIQQSVPADGQPMQLWAASRALAI